MDMPAAKDEWYLSKRSELLGFDHIAYKQLHICCVAATTDMN
jgi:hypothetical protein